MLRHLARSLLLVALVVGAAQAADNATRSRSAMLMLKEKITALPDAAYLRRDDGAVAGLAGTALSSGFRGVLLGAPRRVDAARHPDYAALLLLASSGHRERQLPWDRNAVVVGTDIDTGELFAAPLVAVDESKAPDAAPTPPPPPDLSPPTPLELAGDGSSAGADWLDVQHTLALPRRNMRLALRMFYFDEVSNAAVVEHVVDAGRPGTMPLAQAQAIVARLVAAGQSSGKLPAYRRNSATPALDGPGVTFTLGAIGPSVPLHAALRVEVAPQMLVQPAAAGSAATRATERPAPSAVVRATVLVLQRNHSEPHVLPVDIPVWSERTLTPGDGLDAAFSVDLATLLPPAALQAGAQVYVLAGRHLAGPRALAR